MGGGIERIPAGIDLRDLQVPILFLAEAGARATERSTPSRRARLRRPSDTGFPFSPSASSARAASGKGESCGYGKNNAPLRRQAPVSEWGSSALVGVERPNRRHPTAPKRSAFTLESKTRRRVVLLKLGRHRTRKLWDCGASVVFIIATLGRRRRNDRRAAHCGVGEGLRTGFEDLQGLGLSASVAG
jgi:hypothetical protein